MWSNYSLVMPIALTIRWSKPERVQGGQDSKTAGGANGHDFRVKQAHGGADNICGHAGAEQQPPREENGSTRTKDETSATGRSRNRPRCSSTTSVTPGRRCSPPPESSCMDDTRGQTTRHEEPVSGIVQRQVPNLNLGMVIKVLVMMVILLSRLSQRRKRPPSEAIIFKDYKDYFLMTIAMAAFLVQMGLVKFSRLEFSKV
jgi:hypothetical protein